MNGMGIESIGWKHQKACTMELISSCKILQKIVRDKIY